jgi:hypothetical protein
MNPISLAHGLVLAGGGVGGGGGSGGGFSPLSLFTTGVKGYWLDPSDFSTMFQDVAATTPVTAVGQSVALIRDKSGNNSHFQQPTAGKRPILQQDGNGKYYLQATAANSTVMYETTGAPQNDLRTGSLMWVIGYKYDAAVSQVLISRAYAGPGVGRHYIAFNSGNAKAFDFYYDASGSATEISWPSTAIDVQVATAIIDRAGISLSQRINGNALGTVTGATGPIGTDYNNASYERLFCYGGTSNAFNSGESNFFGGRLYGVIKVLQSLVSSNTDIVNTEQYMAGKCGFSAAVADPLWPLVVFALHGNGANNGTVFPDAKGGAYTWTYYTGAITSTVKSRFSGSSIYNNGGGGIIANQTFQQLASSEWVLDFWLFVDNAQPAADAELVANRGGGAGANFWFVRWMTATGKIRFVQNTGGTNIIDVSSNAVIAKNGWHYIRIQRRLIASTLTMEISIDGVYGSTGTDTGAAFSNPNNPLVFLTSDAGNGVGRTTGYIAEARMAVGGVRDTGANFTPSPLPFPES